MALTRHRTHLGADRLRRRAWTATTVTGLPWVPMELEEHLRA